MATAGVIVPNEKRVLLEMNMDEAKLLRRLLGATVNGDVDRKYAIAANSLYNEVSRIVVNPHDLYINNIKLFNSKDEAMKSHYED